MKKIKQLIIASTVILTSLMTLAGAGDKQAKVYINQLALHPALDATTKGIVDGLAKLGYVKGKNLNTKIESAQGTALLANQIAAKFVSEEADVIVGVATVSSQSLSKYARLGQTRLIFSSVTDPVGSGLVKSLEQPGNNTSGVSNFIPLGPQLEMFRMVKPGLKRLGFLYNPGEYNSISLINSLKELCPQYGMELVTMPAAKTSEVFQSVAQLAQMVDAIFISNDNTALSALKTIIKAAEQQNIPVFVSDVDIVEQGAVAALGPNQYELGLQTAELIVRVLKGEDVGGIPVQLPKKTELYLNLKAAKKLGLNISKELIKKAARVME